MEKSYVLFLPAAAYAVLERAVGKALKDGEAKHKGLRLYIDEPERHVSIEGPDADPLHVELRPMRDDLYGQWDQHMWDAWKTFDKRHGVYIYVKPRPHRRREKDEGDGFSWRLMPAQSDEPIVRRPRREDD